MRYARHEALAITGAVGLATACAEAGTLASAMAAAGSLPHTLMIEHPSRPRRMEIVFGCPFSPSTGSSRSAI
jgi:2-methylaconitate cis-trans-isomerase PrpF